MIYYISQGDGHINYYELRFRELPEGMLVPISSYRTRLPTIGCGALCKRYLDCYNKEIMRLYRAIPGAPGKRALEPISFVVPRCGDFFQEDLFPPCRAPYPPKSSSLGKWLEGADFQPELFDLGRSQYPRDPVERVLLPVQLLLLAKLDENTIFSEFLLVDIVPMIVYYYFIVQDIFVKQVFEFKLSPILYAAFASTFFVVHFWLGRMCSKEISITYLPQGRSTKEYIFSLGRRDATVCISPPQGEKHLGRLPAT
jgi:hypothetical protein